MEVLALTPDTDSFACPGQVVRTNGVAPCLAVVPGSRRHLAARVGLPPESGPGLVSGTFRVGVLISPLLIGGIAEIGGLFLALEVVAVVAVAGAALVILAKPLTD